MSFAKGNLGERYLGNYDYGGGDSLLVNFCFTQQLGSEIFSYSNIEYSTLSHEYARNVVSNGNSRV